MQRSEFQKLARLRLREAQCLLDAGFYDGAYYLAGYAVECALKACIAKKMKRFEYPPRDVRDLYSHDLIALAKRGGVDDTLNNTDPDLKANWPIVKDWDEQERYILGIDLNRARQLIAAITDRSNGVLACLRKLW